jgi:hypothetical protein
VNETAPAARPRIVAWLGYGGLIPFLTLAVLACVDRERTLLWDATLRAYGAVILGFVGALHWGFAMRQVEMTPRQRDVAFGWSVVPALVGFLALVVNSTLGDVLLAGGFIAHYGRDRSIAATARLPVWYLPLRLRLSVVAILCIAAGAVAASR